MAAEGHAGSAPIYQRVIADFISAQPWPTGALSVPETQSHRGYCLDGAQENTLDSFRAAAAHGAQMIELDVRLSQDQIPVVFHDEDLLRLGHESVTVSLLTARQLKEKIHAPTLQEVLADSKVPRKINIELKTDIILDEPLERKVLQVVKACSALGRVMFSSFNPFSLWRMSLMTHRVPLALLVAEDLKYKSLREMWFAPFLKFHALHLSQQMATDVALDFWRSRGVPVAVWTVNDEQQIRTFLEKGCLSVISDHILKT